MPVLIRTIVLAFLVTIFGLISTITPTLQKAAPRPGERVPTSMPRIVIVSSTTPQKIIPSEKPATEAPAKKPEIKIQNPLTDIVQTLSAASSTTPTPLSLNERVRNATVNIICASPPIGPLHSISASGVLIDSRGIIITNSHVAEYLLLKDYPKQNSVQCVVRTGSPAQAKYTLEPLFLPPSWIADNANQIILDRPTGNGEHDYALVRITGTVSPKVLMPDAFPYLAISTTPPVMGEGVLAAGYPAGFLGTMAVLFNLYGSTSFAQVGDVFTFDTDTIDLFSVGGTIVAQQGSSGGAITNYDGVLLGVIVTSTDAPDTASRDLRAIDTPYIIRDFAKEAGISLPEFLSADVAKEATSFQQNRAPALTQKLVNVIENRANL